MSDFFQGLWQELCGGKTPYRVLWLLPPAGVMAICAMLFLVLPVLVSVIQPPPRQPLLVRLVTTVPADRNTVQSADQAANTLLTSTLIAPTSSMVEHPVNRGETLLGILKKYCREQDYRQIAADNGIDNPNLIVAGKTVLRFRSGCDAKTVVKTARPVEQAVTTPAVRRSDLPVRQSQVAAASPVPTATLADGCEAGLKNGYTGTGRARRSLTDREIMGCIDRVYGHYVREASRLTGLPTDLLLGKIFVESRGRKDARRSDGPVGLSQLQPETARSYGVPPNRLHDPEVSILTGARILADYVRKANDDIALGLVYYNAGPNRAFHRRAGFQPERFPFVERVARAQALLAQ